MISQAEVLSDEKRRARLTWRAKRGLLENDIVLTRYFERYGATMTEQDVYALDLLMDLPDDELFALIMNRKSLSEVDEQEHMITAADMDNVNRVLDILKQV